MVRFHKKVESTPFRTDWRSWRGVYPVTPKPRVNDVTVNISCRLKVVHGIKKVRRFYKMIPKLMKIPYLEYFGEKNPKLEGREGVLFLGNESLLEIPSKKTLSLADNTVSVPPYFMGVQITLYK